jgi:hypothetical protein
MALETAWKALKSIVSAPVGMAKTVMDEAGKPDTTGMGLGPRLVGRMIVDPALATGRKAIDAAKQGRYSEAAGYGLGAVLPVLGPALAHGGEGLGTGDPKQMTQAAGDLVAAAPAVMRGTGRMVSAAGRAAKDAGRSTWMRAAKIDESTSKKTASYRKTGDFAAGEREIADTVLSRGRGAFTRENAGALAAERKAASDAVGEAVENITQPITPVPMLRSMANEARSLRRESDPGAGAAKARYQEMREQWSEPVPVVKRDGPIMTRTGPQNAEQAAVEGFGQYQPVKIATKQRPRDLSAREVQDFDVAAGRRNATRFEQRGNPVAPAVSRVDMAGSKTGRAVLREKSAEISKANKDIPDLGTANDTIAAVKPAQIAMSKARKRVGHHDPIGLTQAVLGAGGAMTMGPMGAAMALLPMLQRGGPLSRVGQSLYTRGGQAARAGGAISQNARLAALLQLLEQAQEE